MNMPEGIIVGCYEGLGESRESALEFIEFTHQLDSTAAISTAALNNTVIATSATHSFKQRQLAAFRASVLLGYLIEMLKSDIADAGVAK